LADLLDQYLAEEIQRPFEWGCRNGDCLLFLLGWAELCGKKASRQWRGSYTSEDGARSALFNFGGAKAALFDVFGQQSECSPSRGDVGLLRYDDWHLGVICTGRMWVMRAGTRGVSFTRRCPEIVCAVRVP